jgi:ATP-dependent RNA helicase DeaD
MENLENKDTITHNLKKMLNHPDLPLHQRFIEQLSAELEIDTLRCAAALSLVNQLGSSTTEAQPKSLPTESPNNTRASNYPKKRMVRYRLDVGLKHQIKVDEIKSTLVEVSGVERKKITQIDVRNHYTLVDLPEGMTADIFQLLTEAEIQSHKLGIKRVKFHRRFQRRKSRSQAS